LFHRQNGVACGLLFSFSFLDKEYILILRRYQLYPVSATTQCPSGNTDAHGQLKQKKKYEIEKSPALAINSS
jgi:hypothetical protein